jgi:ribose/xylose/arabinose/galactoside ABC-type transport system permease subunit
MQLKPPLIPFPIIAAVAIGLIVHFGLMRTSFGAILRGAGGNPVAIRRAGWSLLKTKIVMFTLALAANSLLSFMHIPPDWQVGANGAILIIVLAARVVLSRRESRQ